MAVAFYKRGACSWTELKDVRDDRRRSRRRSRTKAKRKVDKLVHFPFFSLLHSGLVMRSPAQLSLSSCLCFAGASPYFANCPTTPFSQFGIFHWTPTSTYTTTSSRTPTVTSFSLSPLLVLRKDTWMTEYDLHVQKKKAAERQKARAQGTLTIDVESESESSENGERPLK